MDASLIILVTRKINKMMKLRICLFLAMLGLLSNCRKDEIVVDPPREVIEETIVLDGYEPDQQTVKASVFGQILNENGDPLEGVKIEVEEADDLTDENGYFYLKGIDMNALGTLLMAKKDGYVNGSRVFYPTESSKEQIEIKLIPRNFIDDFNAADGGIVQVEGGAEILFESNSFVLASDGTEHIGSVNVVAKYLDPTDVDNFSEIPGDLTGIRPSALYEEVGLLSYGMLMVELYSDEGRKLQLAEGTSAELTVPIPPSMLANAPTNMPLWYFNESVGKWVEDGEATLVNGVYKGNVTHFTTWNCDYPIEIRHKLTTIFKDHNKVPISSMRVQILFEGSVIGSRFTNPAGEAYFNLPENIDVSIQASVTTNGEKWQEEIMGLTEATTKTYIIGKEYENRTLVSGHIKCNDQDVNDAVLTVENNDGINFYPITGQPFEVLIEASDLQGSTRMYITDVSSKNATQTVYYEGALPNFYFNELDMCGHELDEYTIMNLGPSQFVDDDVTMWVSDEVNPPVTVIGGRYSQSVNPENRFCFYLHGDFLAGDFSKEMEVDGKTFIQNYLRFKFTDLDDLYFGTNIICEVTKYDVGGYIEVEFATMFEYYDNINVEYQRGPIFGSIKVKYENDPTQDESYFELVTDKKRIVTRGLSGSSSTDGSFAINADPQEELYFHFVGDKAGDYSASTASPSNPFPNRFLGIEKELPFKFNLTTMESFMVNDFGEAGNYVKGSFSGEAKNGLWHPDWGPHQVSGSFSILHE